MGLLHPPFPDDLVTFNVRGRIFQTTLTTLRRFPESVLCKMIKYEQERNRAASSEPTGQQAFFIDRDADLFAAILRFHDTEEYEIPPSNITPQSLRREAVYYNLQSLEEQIIVQESLSDKYQFCYLSSCDPYRLTLTLSNDAIKANSYSGFEKLNLDIKGTPLVIQLIEGELRIRNSHVDGYHWTLWAVTGAGIESLT